LAFFTSILLELDQPRTLILLASIPGYRPEYTAKNIRLVAKQIPSEIYEQVKIGGMM
jgi:hypothetical protein